MRTKTIRPRVGSANRGKALESLIDASRADVQLYKIPNGIKYIGGGKTIPTKSPVDYMGCLMDGSGRMLATDAKVCDDPHRLILSTSTLKPHQREQLAAFGRAGAVSGILALSSAMDSVHWFSWWIIGQRVSIPWNEAVWSRTARLTIRWGELVAAHNLAWDRHEYRDDFHHVNGFEKLPLAREAAASVRLDGETLCVDLGREGKEE